MLRTAGIKSIAFLAAVAVAWIASAPVSADSVPSYAHPNNQQLIRGRIDSVDGTWQISVLDDSNGYIDKVGLHQGTVINPTGITLQPGMRVTILGYPAGAVFEANKIDTPYDAYRPSPYPSSWYPYYGPYYGPGWGYPGFGPFLNVGIGGFGGGYHSIRGRDTFRGNASRGDNHGSSSPHSGGHSGGRHH
ncbi:MAG TPA: hypothetical protein VIJ12_10620 [Candidatus Baltobacteraceae bacterium]